MLCHMSGWCGVGCGVDCCEGCDGLFLRLLRCFVMLRDVGAVVIPGGGVFWLSQGVFGACGYVCGLVWMNAAVRLFGCCSRGIIMGYVLGRIRL